MSAPYDEEADGRMTEKEILSAVRSELDSSVGWTGTRLRAARERNLEEWMGARRGDEIEGRSQVTSRVVFEQVETMLPGMLEPFVSSETSATFVPRSPEDEQAAKDATIACNHVLNQAHKLDVLTTFARDGLIQRVGVVKVAWSDASEGYFETYEGKTIQEAVLLEQDKHFEFKEVTPVMYDAEGDLVDVPEEALESGMIPPEAVLYTIRGVRRRDDGRVVIDNIAPEEFMINRDSRGLDHHTTRFVAHQSPMSESDLVAMGIDPEVVKRIPTAHNSGTTEQASRVRSSQQDGQHFALNFRTDSERQIIVTEAYILLDTDGDGVSEWWRCLVGGDYGQTMIDFEPVDGHPFAAWCPIPIPHRFFGLGLADVVSDINEINTTLWRQYLDCLYLATDPRNVVLSAGQGDTAAPMVNLEQLMDATPGNYIEEYQPGALRPYEQSSNAADIIPAMQLNDDMLKKRTGISPDAGGLDPSMVNQTAYGVMVDQGSKTMRTSLMTRNFAEQGVRKIFQLIYKELLQHGQEMQVQSGGEWMTLNPSDWATNLDCTIAVGLGHGTRMEKISNLQTLGNIQKELLTGGKGHMVTDQNLFETASKLVEALGFSEPTQFITDPSTVPPPQPKPDPNEQFIQAQQVMAAMDVELRRQKLEIDRFRAMADAKKDELDHEREIQKLRADGYPAEMDAPYTMAPVPGGLDEATFADLLGDVEAAVMGLDGGEEPPVQ